MWKHKKRYLYLNYEETRVVLQSLIRLKNTVMQTAKFIGEIPERAA